MGYIFNVGDVVEVVCEDSFFVGIQGIIKDVLVNEHNDTVYGVEDMFESELMYFLAKDLKEVK